MATDREKKDAVTVGEIRRTIEDRLDNQIATISGCLRRRNVAEAKRAFESAVGTILELEELDSKAGLPGLIKAMKG